MEVDDRLEQRVKTLEYEFKILKNEIQRVLLDIQEQILIHYYPALRAEDSVPAPEVVQSFSAVKERRAAPSVASLASEAAEPEIPQVRKVSLEEVRRAREEPAEASAQPEAPKGPQGAQPNLIALTGWVSSTVSKIGKERATRLLEMVHQKGYLDDQVKEVLVKLCVVTEGDVTEKVAINDILTALLRLNELLGRGTNVEEALSIIDEAKLG